MFFTKANESAHQEINMAYDTLGGGRLHGLARLVGIARNVNQPLYEPAYAPTGLKAIVEAIEWIAVQRYGSAVLHRLHETPSLYTPNLEGLVFGMNSTTAGGVGWGPSNIRPDDRIFVLPGGRTPVVLRRETTDRIPAKYELVGDCYLEGTMDGEWALAASKGPLRLTARPTVFWSRFKYDMVKYLNELATAKIVRITAQNNHPLLPFIDKPGALDIWLNEITQWATDWMERTGAVARPGFNKLPAELQDSNNYLCTAFRNIENMPKPYWSTFDPTKPPSIAVAD
ncbi:hypothetical protein PG997_015301 [Apiospora hydei]|uniref:Uncharacterized protein n=1 Tax=Apiospora hydei TaxID=1337664 RepID=A0ABR1UQ79_9PEZI